MLSDEAMVGRLGWLYGWERAERIGKCWEHLRKHGFGHLVDERKERYCRRMYNLSQFVKTLKERVSSWYNETFKHTGTIWEGRFYSGVVEKNAVVKAVVAAYVGFNPVKAKLVASPDAWRWSSYSLAVSDGGPDGERCRAMYERMLGRPWAEVRETLESIYADGLPDSLTPEDLKKRYDDNAGESDDDAAPMGAFRASQAVRATMKLFSGAYIGRDVAFFERVTSLLPKRFPRAGRRSIGRCLAFRWELPPRLRSAA